MYLIVTGNYSCLVYYIYKAESLVEETLVNLSLYNAAERKFGKFINS